MATYNTYQECKIANPESDIYRYFSELYGIFFNVKVSIDGIEGVRRALCDPADYCITVEKFLADGHKVFMGDVIINANGNVNNITQGCANMLNGEGGATFNDTRYILHAAALGKPLLQTGEDFEHSKTLNFIRDRLVEAHGEPKNLDYMHKLNNAIAFVERMEEAKIGNDGFEPASIKESQVDKRKCKVSIKHPEGATGYREQGKYTEWFKGSKEKGWSIFCSDAPSIDDIDTSLPVIAIEKPKRTKVEWGCVHYSEVVHYFDVAGSDLYYAPSSNSGKCNSLQDYIDNLQDDGDPCLYRRIETEITERDEFIEETKKLAKTTAFDTLDEELAMAMYDSGKFKLVN